MRRIFLCLVAVLCSFVALHAIDSRTLQARCSYYAGYGYRCFGDKGGTGGKVFKQMDENAKKCGYWNPGCTTPQATTKKATPPHSDQKYTPPKTDGGYQSPTVGPGYQPPGSR